MRKPIFKVGRMDDGTMELHAEWYTNDGNAGLHAYSIGRIASLTFSGPGLLYMSRVERPWKHARKGHGWMVLAIGPVTWELRIGRKET